MPTLAEVRQKYPQYADLSDQDLAKGLYQKYYSDMPYDQFSQKVGLSTAQPAQTPQQPEPSFMSQLGRQAGLQLARVPIDVVAALPLMAMNAGVGARNLLTGSNYELPGETFNKALDQYLPHAQTTGEKVITTLEGMLLGGKMPAPQELGDAKTAISGMLGFGKPPASAPSIPSNFVSPPANMTQEVLRSGQQAGYVAPPAQARPSWGARLGEAMAGKASVAQAAGEHNQTVTNTLARRALGLSDDAPLTVDTLSAIRANAGRVYKQVADTGEIAADNQFLDDLSNIGRSAEEIAKDFPDADVAASKEIGDLTNSLLRDKFSAKSAVEYLKELRSQASSNLSYQASADPAKRALGMAQREAAASLEDLIGRHLVQQGQPELAGSFDQARKLIAKTYSVQSALNESTGNVVANALGSQLKRGKPLSGQLELAARFARAFPKATRETNESQPFLSPWDFGWGGIGSIAAGNPLPFAYPFARIGIRKFLLSPAGQRMAAGQGTLGQIPPGLVMGSVPVSQQLTQ